MIASQMFLHLNKLKKVVNMRELTHFEQNLIAGGCDKCRDDAREILVDTSLVVAPFMGGELGLTATAGMGLGYTVGGYVAGAFAAIVAVPVLVKLGLELAFTMHDVLVTA